MHFWEIVNNLLELWVDKLFTALLHCYASNVVCDIVKHNKI